MFLFFLKAKHSLVLDCDSELSLSLMYSQPGNNIIYLIWGCIFGISVKPSCSKINPELHKPEACQELGEQGPAFSISVPTSFQPPYPPALVSIRQNRKKKKKITNKKPQATF